MDFSLFWLLEQSEDPIDHVMLNHDLYGLLLDTHLLEDGYAESLCDTSILLVLQDADDLFTDGHALLN